MKVENKIQSIHKKLLEKFGENLEQSLAENKTKLDEIEVKSRTSYYLGEILSQDKVPTNPAITTKPLPIMIYFHYFRVRPSCRLS